MTTELKQQIANTLSDFKTKDFFDNSIELFKILGYNTSRSLKLSKSDYNTFKEEFNINATTGFNEKNALVNQWKAVNLLFQLTAEEMKPQAPLFVPTIARNEPASFLFFAIELSGSEYSRTQLAAIAREVNKPFPMDVFLLFKYGEHLALSLIERRPNKRIMDRDVLEKVTHIYNISIAKPHAAHIQILYTFSYEGIELESKKKTLQNFKELQTGWKKVASTQVLNTQFYKDYQHLSVKLIKAIKARQPNKMLAHQGILNLLNRIMFIYFVQKKQWIMQDDNFILHFWKDYKEEGLDGKDQFHELWLNTVFFSAFNGEAYKNPKGIKALPEPYKSGILEFPYLNGGLFAFNKELDDFILADKYFHDIFHFFESYIFTIAEDTPYDVNMEINPELLGKMYEGMINATDLDDVDAEHGIVYTERPEINFMVRRSLVEVLHKKLEGLVTREFVYHFIFDTAEEKSQLLLKTKIDITALRNGITSLTACDPSCGSGSMLLGVIQVQMELLRSIDDFSGKRHTPKDDFVIKKQLISECIFGVDIKEWAVRIAELRLWLYMISEATFTPEELIKEPLLPNLDFKLRCGNSLLQKFGNFDFTLEDLFKGKPKTSGAARNLHNYIKKKKAFILNQADSKTSYQQLKGEEKAVFLDLIQEMLHDVEKQLHNRKASLIQGTMFSGATQASIFTEQIEELLQRQEQLKAVRQYIHKEKRLPFSYDIDFMEVFVAKEDDKGFDLVIGNPPYVKEADILPPENAEYLSHLMEKNMEGKLINAKEKAAVNLKYKASLNEKAYSRYPFLKSEVKTIVQGKNVTIPIYGKKIPGKADLYVYFQIICPSYLNQKGVFCFIISNSWLDVDFGVYVQNFLLKHTKLKVIYDCSNRSFDAAVNTIIYLHGPIENRPKFSGKEKKYENVTPMENNVKFVLNKIDFTVASYSKLLIEQESIRSYTSNSLYRVFNFTQEYLYQVGFDFDESKYTGDKWYGLYFKAPEIFNTLSNNIKFRPISEIGEIKLGLTSCQNDFFYLEKDIIEEYSIESKFLKPIFKSPQECSSISIEEKDLKLKLLLCNESLEKITSVGVKKYIKQGVKDEINKVACLQSRNLWYSVGIPSKANVVLPYSYGESFKTYYSEKGVYCDKRLVMFFPFNKENEKEYILLLNCSIWFLFIETYGSGNLGEGALVFNTKNFRKIKLPSVVKEVSKYKYFDSLINRKQNDIFTELGFNRELPIREQYPNPLLDRAALDTLIFDSLSLTNEERTEVYWSVAELVQQRMNKAASR